MLRTAAAVGVLLVVLGSAEATPVIEVGTHNLLPDRAGQVIRISVTGGDPVQGLELNAQIQDGSSGPIFEDADILTGTIFAGNNLGLFAGGYIDPRRLYVGLVTQTGSVDANGLIAILTVRTTGLYGGTYALSLTNSLEGTTNFAGAAASITEGTIVIVPEPAVLALLAAGAAVLQRRRGRK